MEQNIKASDPIKNGMAKKQAAGQSQILQTMLQFCIKKPDHKPQPGPSPVLNADKEKELVKC